MSPVEKKTHSIAVVAYPDVQMSAVLGLQDLFKIANDHSRLYAGSQLRVSEVSKDIIIDKAPGGFEAVILPPSIRQSRGEGEQAIQSWLCSQHAAGAMMSSVCVGAYWLAYSGLLKGRPATTHWAVEEDFRMSFPDIQLNTDRLLVDDDDIVTTGGLMAWLDLGLYIVNRWLGPKVVSDTARHLLIDPAGREQQSYRTFQPRLNHGDKIILKSQHWLEGRVHEEITVGKIAAEMSLTGRTFLRRFTAATGYTPIAYLQQLRIEKARGLLEHSLMSISEIGYKVGYQDTSAFSRVFRTTTGLTAGEYRNRFGVRSRTGRTTGRTEAGSAKPG